jgi:hypothetical protein
MGRTSRCPTTLTLSRSLRRPAVDRPEILTA